MVTIKPKLIVIDRAVRNEEMVARICNHFPQVETKIIEEQDFLKSIEDKEHSRTIGKTIIHLAQYKGEVVKPCPGTNCYLCCGYQVIAPVENCSMECTYCILQYYLNNSVIRIFPEIDKILGAIIQSLRNSPDKLHRIGSGELSDSLLYDQLTGFSSKVIEYLKPYRNILFEFKTKTANIDNLLNVEGNPSNIVVGWSLNTPTLIEEEEIKTASFEQRLDAAAKCAERGYKLSFHFDPIIIYDNCVEEYEATVERLFSSIPLQNIAWISLGMLRYPSGLQNIIGKRFPKTKIIYGEKIQGNDGKIRYFKKIRLKTYKKIYNKIMECANSPVFVYFCMESQEIWESVTGFAPADNFEFEETFDKAMIEKFGISC